MDFIKPHYPDAITLTDLEKIILSDLDKNDFTLSKTVWGTSICSDEVNNSFNIFSKHFVGPGPFRFGGISGLPFTGKTGIFAFASHIPKNGGAFILYGPHIGISDQGVLGELLRQRQSDNTTCCGSLVSGLKVISSDEDIKTDPVHDLQQHVVVRMLESNKEDILNVPDTIKKATDVTYNNIKKEILWLVKNSTNIPSRAKIYLMGGILINTDFDKEDWFDVRDTELIQF